MRRTSFAQVDPDGDGVCTGNKFAASRFCVHGKNDNCPLTPNPLQEESACRDAGNGLDPCSVGDDADGDGVSDACDNCVFQVRTAAIRSPRTCCFVRAGAG